MASKTKLPKLSTLVNKADTVFSKYIRQRDTKTWVQDETGLSIPAGYCVTCLKLTPTGGRGSGHAGHFIGRGCKLTRYDERNVNLQCNYCNTYKHGEQYKHSLYIDATYGAGTAQELHELERQYKAQGYKFTREELENVVANYGSMLQ